MTERREPSSVEETASAWEPAAPDVIRARPVQGPVDWDALLDDIRRRFPKTLARLAE